MICLCTKPIPNARIGDVQDAEGKLLARFHLDCVEHGITVTMRPMRRVLRSNWLTASEMVAQIAFYRQKDGLRRAQVSPDGKQLLVEWFDWEFIEEGEST